MREIVDFPGYWAGEDGHIYSTRGGHATTPRLLKETDGRYLTVSLRRTGRGSRQSVHILVCVAWHGPRPLGKQVSHLNEAAHDNRPANLAWETAQQNMHRRGYTQFSGEQHPRARLTDAQIAEVKHLLTEGLSLSEIGRRYGITPRYVGYLRDGERRHTEAQGG